MKTVMLKLSVLLSLFLCATGAGCEDDNGISQSTLNGKWILVGFGNDSISEFISEPDSEPTSSYVLFDNGKLEAHSVTNHTYDMRYELTDEHQINIINKGGRTKVGGDTEWGERFLLSIDDVKNFEKNNDELIIYYNGNTYMKFKKSTK